MSQKFAVPCPCGDSVLVDVRQAGDQVQCSKCQQTIEVPPLRELKQLEPVAVSEPVSVAGSDTSWSGLPGALFALGLLSLVIASAAGYYTYATRSRMVEWATPPQEKIQFELDIQDISLVDSWETWKDFNKIQLSRRPQPVHVMAQSRVTELNNWLRFFGGLATVGLVSMIVSFLVRPRKLA